MNSKRSKVYADVNVKKGAEFFNYEDQPFHYGHQESYEIVRKIGRGRYAEVFEGVNIVTNDRCVLKILKPIKKKKIHREIKVLQALAGCPNIPKFYDIVHDHETNMTSLILEYANGSGDNRSLFAKFTDFDTRFYMFELLKTLDFAHSNGIMHRDVKPHNLIIDHEKRELKLIDWGLADFYLPNTEFNTRVMARYTKAPELLVEYPFYNYSIDVWGAGCIFAGIIFMRDPFFQGADNIDQLEKITRILGTQELFDYLKKYKITLEGEIEGALRTTIHTKKAFSKLITTTNQHLIPEDALNLLERMLTYDHVDRITSAEALSHPYFAPVIEYHKSRKIPAMIPEKSATAAGEKGAEKKVVAK